MNPFQQVFFPIFGAGCLVGAVLSWFAAGRRIPARVLLLGAALLAVWYSMHLGVCEGFDAWQGVPDPPDEAYADGALLTGSILFGWIPSAFGCGVVFLAARAWRGRQQASPPSVAGG